VHPGLALAGARYVDRILEGSGLQGEEAYIFFRRYLTEVELAELYTDDFRAELHGADAARRHREHFAHAPATDFLNRVLYVDAQTFLVDHNLLYSDKMSSAASLELRVPYLDNEVADFAARLPPELKLRGLTGKFALRLAATGLVPNAVIGRRKAGFGAPVRAWLGRELRPMMEDLLGAERLRARGWFRPEAVRRLVDEHVSGRGDHTYRLWSLLSLELWHREFIDSGAPPAR
jgi:asparagine synthase (glutamine-hydrolysing)